MIGTIDLERDKIENDKPKKPSTKGVMKDMKNMTLYEPCISMSRMKVIIIIFWVVVLLLFGYIAGYITNALISRPVKAEGNYYYKTIDGKYHRLSKDTYTLTVKDKVKG